MFRTKKASEFILIVSKDESIDEVKTGEKVPGEEKKSIPAENEAKENSNNEDEKSEKKE